MLKTEQVLNQQQDLILECVSRGIARSFGDGVKQVILYQFKLATKSDEIELIRNPRAFMAFLEKFFGGRGSQVVEDKIVDEIKREFKIAAERPITLESAVRAASLHLESRYSA